MDTTIRLAVTLKRLAVTLTVLGALSGKSGGRA
jgi:hypothetical protein